jgi:hypothetical protein
MSHPATDSVEYFEMKDVEEVQYRAIVPGVAGWLAVLCLILMVSAGTIFYDIAAVTIPTLIRAQTARLAVLLGAYSVLFTITASLSLTAGAKLWLIKPDAVSFAKRFLAIHLIAHIAYFLLWTAIIRPDELHSIMQTAWYHVVGPAGFVYLWSSYLQHSRRVRETYPAQ